MLRFDDAIIDIPRRTLTVDGEVRHLEPQAFDLLAFLVAHRERVVPKHELLDAVWGDQFVSESALTTRVKEIRRALGDDGTRQRFVRNFRGRGYRFVADADDRHREPVVANASGLVGREREVSAILDALGDSPLVTLVGPGGVGKTTLAREVARQVPLHGTTARDVHILLLGAVSDEAGLRRAFERCCDISGPLDDESLAAAIADLDALVVVDNCEHLVGAVARLVELIDVRNGRVRLLTTSRERLGLPEEQVLRIEPLDASAARALLIARATAAHPGTSIDGDDPDVDRLLAILDHLPLAIEMAAAHLANVGVAELCEVLAERLDLLASANRAAFDRQRTLAGVIDWSERLLSPGAARLLHELSVFTGPVTADDIAAVVGATSGELTLGPLSDLVEHSLVVADTSGSVTRYRQLTTVRSVVAPQRDRDVDERHARHIADAVDGADRLLRSVDEGRGVDRLRPLESEIGAAHAWARQHDHALAARLTTALLHYAHERVWGEPVAWARALLDHPRLRVDRRPFAAAVAADASNRDDIAAAVEHATAAVDSDEPRVAASAHDTLANVGMYTGDLAAALRHGAAEARIGRSVGDTTMEALGLVNGMLSRVYAGELAAARRAFDERTLGGVLSATSSAWLAYGEGELLAGEGDDRAAVAQFQRAVELGESVDSRFVVGVAQVAELASRARSGDIGESIRAFHAVLARYRRQHDVTHAVTAMRNLIVLLVRDGRDEPGMRLLGALSTPTVKATYGTESANLAAARDTAEARGGREQVAHWMADGSGRGFGWALDTAIDLLAG